MPPLGSPPPSPTAILPVERRSRDSPLSYFISCFISFFLLNKDSLWWLSQRGRMWSEASSILAVWSNGGHVSAVVVRQARRHEIVRPFLCHIMVLSRHYYGIVRAWVPVTSICGCWMNLCSPMTIWWRKRPRVWGRVWLWECTLFYEIDTFQFSSGIWGWWWWIMRWPCSLRLEFSLVAYSCTTVILDGGICVVSVNSIICFDISNNLFRKKIDTFTKNLVFYIQDEGRVTKNPWTKEAKSFMTSNM